MAVAPIQTERLTLRPLAESDIDDVWQYQQLDEVLLYIPWPKRDFDEAAAHTRKRAGLHTLDTDNSAIFLACELDGRVIGDVMLRVSSVETAELEIGWVFHPDVQGRGYATEAAAAMQRLAFDGIGAHRLIAQLDPRNTASARLCARLGLAHEGTLREAYYEKDADGNGEWSDSGLYGMTAHDWRALEDTPAPHTP
ncbi:hypothetical protein AWU67_14845 [Microterricola viridarii]|uniref:N-acetyltransferase domain-containing protein n=1 Tax=Microterricola viridarii TaxID=412690 RepID=A0A0Y0P8H2_9MICO|nr:hypothetical protein AWU67_14845 [Microterricola viridarii]